MIISANAVTQTYRPSGWQPASTTQYTHDNPRNSLAGEYPTNYSVNPTGRMSSIYQFVTRLAKAWRGLENKSLEIHGRPLDFLENGSS